MKNMIGKRVGFPFRLSDRNRISLVGDDTAIRQSIFLIIHTVPGERVMHPTFGCEIHSLIFAPANDETAILAERYVREALTLWEPRILLENVQIEISNTGYGELVINIAYRLKGEHDIRNLVYPYYLNPLERQDT
jgi:hypothetical protein